MAKVFVHMILSISTVQHTLTYVAKKIQLRCDEKPTYIVHSLFWDPFFFFFFVVVVSFVWFFEYFNLSLYQVDVCVCDSAPSVNTQTSSPIIFYSIPSSFVYRLSSSEKRKKEGSDALENNKQSLQPCPGKKEKKRRKKNK